MPLTKSELLIPRVLCIGGKDGEPNYPGGIVNTGDILSLSNSGFSYTDGVDKYIKTESVEVFPHLFKPLPWYYGRTVEEMPKFVKCINTPDQVHFPDEVFKVNWKLSHLGFSDRGAIVPNTDCYLPADESDYQEYQKQKEAK